MTRSVDEAIALHRELGRRSGEPDDAYHARLVEVAAEIGPDEAAFVDNVLLPRWATLFGQGPGLPATAAFGRTFSAEEKRKFQTLQQALRRLRLAYDDIVWRVGTAYWRTLRDHGPEAAEVELKAYLQQQGVNVQRVAEAARTSQEQARNTTAAVHTSLSVAALVASVVPVVGWVVSLAIGLAQAAMALAEAIARPLTARELEKRRGAWDQFEQDKRTWHTFDLKNRLEGVQTYRGFLIVPGVSPDTFNFEDGVALVNRRLYTLSLASGRDWSVPFPLLPFGQVVAEPYLVEGLPDIGEGDAIEIARRRQLGPAAGGSAVATAQAWFDRGRRRELGAPTLAIGKIPQFDGGLGSDGPYSFYKQGYIEQAAGMAQRRIDPSEVGEGPRAQGTEERVRRQKGLVFWLAGLFLLR